MFVVLIDVVVVVFVVPQPSTIISQPHDVVCSEIVNHIKQNIFSCLPDIGKFTKLWNVTPFSWCGLIET